MSNFGFQINPIGGGGLGKSTNSANSVIRTLLHYLHYLYPGRGPVQIVQIRQIMQTVQLEIGPPRPGPVFRGTNGGREKRTNSAIGILLHYLHYLYSGRASVERVQIVQ